MKRFAKSSFFLTGVLLLASCALNAQSTNSPGGTNAPTVPVQAAWLESSVSATPDPEHPVSSVPGETRSERDARMGWWRDAKFGMFIHWGVYAVPAGVYKGKEIKTGTGEWIMNYARIPVAEYRAYGKQFNPVKYDPAVWIALAKEAGMKYIVITAKHHDGFALFDSKISDWNVVQATPYGKDLIAPLAKAARAAGLKFGIYYSHDLDWSHPGGGGCMMEQLPDGKFVKAGGKWDKAQEGSFHDYLRDVSLPQVRELLAAYQPDTFWWDYSEDMTPELAKPFHDLILKYPKIITNNRLGGGFQGDLGTPEQHVPGGGTKENDWETCMTMNETWGFKSYDHGWKSPEKIIQTLVEVVGKGGNFLLNVGPTAEGIIPSESAEILKKVGAWIKINGEGIYGTRKGPYEHTAALTSTRKGSAIYIFIDPLKGQVVTLPPLPAKVIRGSLLGGGDVVVNQSPEGLVLRLPASVSKEASTIETVKLLVEGDALAIPTIKASENRKKLSTK